MIALQSPINSHIRNRERYSEKHEHQEPALKQLSLVHQSEQQSQVPNAEHAQSAPSVYVS